MRVNYKRAYTFDDAILREIDQPKQTLALERELFGFKLKLPILSSPMDTLTDGNFAIKIAELGGVGIIHKNLSIEEQVAEVRLFRERFKRGEGFVGAAIGVGQGAKSVSEEHPGLERARELIEAGVDCLVLDTGHGHSKRVIDLLKSIKLYLPPIKVIVGNIATSRAANMLIKAGADAIKVGIGCGSICTTRVVAGVGSPQLSALLECAKVANKLKVPLIADGGLKSASDIAKALLTGADLIMLGSMLAASEEALGEIREIGGRRYHYFRGMGSLKAMNSGSADRYAHEGSVRLVAEGIEALKEIKGSLKEILSQLKEELLRELAKVDISRYKNPRQRFVFKVRWEKKLPLNQLLLLPNYSKIIPKDVRLRCNFENKRYNLPLLILLPEGAKELAKNLRKQGFLAVNLGLREGKDSDRFSLLEKVDTKTIRSISSLDREHVVLLNITKNSLELLKNLDLSKIKARLILTNDLVLEGLKQDPNILLVRGDFNSLNTLDLSSFSYKPKIVFSGKISSSGDLAKALAAGADMILYDLSKEKNLELRGVERRLEGEKGALSSAFAYLGARDIKKLQQAARFVRQSQAGRLESLPHSVLSLEEF